MNHTLPALLLLGLSINAHGQKVAETDVPAPVKAAFAKQFPKVHDAKWELEDKKDYEANFGEAGIHWSVAYAADGTWRETEHAIGEGALPEAVRKAIAAKYAGHQVKQAEMAETPKGTQYEVDLAKGGHTMEVVFSASGTVLKSGSEEDEKNEKDEEKEEDE